MIMIFYKNSTDYTFISNCDYNIEDYYIGVIANERTRKIYALL